MIFIKFSDYLVDNEIYLANDKTGKIAIPYKEDYSRKMFETINDLNATELKKDPNNILFNKVKTLIKESIWPDNKLPIIKNFTPITPRLFGKYKDHKDPPKLRPIVSSHESLTYPLETYMKTIYHSLLPLSNSSLISTRDFINRIRNHVFTKDDRLISFDIINIINLYPSVDPGEIIPIVNEMITKFYKDQEVCNTLISINNILLNESYFQFGIKFLKQTRSPYGFSHI